MSAMDTFSKIVFSVGICAGILILAAAFLIITGSKKK